MSVTFKTPNITGSTDREKLAQMQSYLIQMVRQLQWAFDTIQVGTFSETVPHKVQTANGSASGTASDPASTFNSIKALIIKSADIIKAYQEKMEENFSGVFVAQSDFGTYTEETDQRIETNSTEISQFFTNLQTIVETMDNLERTVIGVNAYINSGLLFYDSSGAPVYGIEVGQRSEVDGIEVFNKYARFTANKLSFYDSNDNEVAYISDYKLYITNVQVTGSYRIGHLVDTAQSDGSVITKYIIGE